MPLMVFHNDLWIQSSSLGPGERQPLSELQESLQARMTDEDRPTVEDLRWMRLVMKAGGGLFKEKVMPSLAEINRLLRERHGDVSSQGSEVPAEPPTVAE